jgi:hypothetical protein
MHYGRTRRVQEVGAWWSSEPVCIRECNIVGVERRRRSEHCREVEQCVPESGVVLWSGQKGVGGRTTGNYEWDTLSAHGCTRQWRCVMVGPRGCRSEHSRDVKQCAPESGDVIWSDQEGVGGRTTVEK